jgi:predicted PhzF superfamily epimerase YddE/YHI9
MQAFAADMGLSETAYLSAHGDGNFDLRWFTPSVEVDLCGHATLASAHVLWEILHIGPAEEARFHTRSGVLTAVRDDSGLITMDFPATPVERCDPPPGLQDALGAPALFMGRTMYDYLVHVDSADVVRQLAPAYDRLRSLPVRGIIVTARADADEGVHFVSRFFAPGAGIDEDPVTGSAHCALGPYWGKLLGEEDLIGYQASDRGGVVHVGVRGGRVLLGGHVQTTRRFTTVPGSK